MKINKVALITKKTPSDWKSCKLITSNLFNAYCSAFPEESILPIGVDADLNDFLAFKLAEQLKNGNVDLVVWLEHRPNFTKIMRAMDFVYGENLTIKKPKIIIHVFGDFVLDTADWLLNLKHFKNWPIYFFTASERQKNLLNLFFPENLPQIGIFPFPVDELVFSMENFDTNRTEVRSKYNLSPDTRVFLYTGRVSFQKNIESLIKAFVAIEKNIDDVELWIAGSFDDLLFPYAGKHGVVGSYYSYLKSKNIDFNHPKIKFLGNLSSNELVKAYHGADCFISLSTHNDEDYGMSPAEALMCGMPCLLSNWGGYSSFKKISERVNLIKVCFGQMRPIADSIDTQVYMMEYLLNKPLTKEDREKISKSAQDNISLRSAKKKILEKLKVLEFSSIQSYSPLFEEVANRFLNKKAQPFKCETGEFELDKLYLKTYEVYCE